MKKPSWGEDSHKYKGLKREKVIDWVNQKNLERYDITAARVDARPVYYENMFDQNYAEEA